MQTLDTTLWVGIKCASLVDDRVQLDVGSTDASNGDCVGALADPQHVLVGILQSIHANTSSEGECGYVVAPDVGRALVRVKLRLIGASSGALGTCMGFT